MHHDRRNPHCLFHSSVFNVDFCHGRRDVENGRSNHEAFPHVRFFLMYGQTEATARLSYLPPERLADKLGSIGRGLPSVRLEVLKRDGTPVVPGSAETGEIVAAGDNIALGYWNDPE